MYRTINGIKGKKLIDLSYSIQNFDSDRKIAVIRMLSDNVIYEILKLRAVMDPISNTKKMIPSGTYAGRELLSIVEGMVELNQFVVDDQVIKKNKLKGIMEMIINFDELNNSDNLKDGHPSNALFMYSCQLWHGSGGVILKNRKISINYWLLRPCTHNMVKMQIL